MSYETFRTSLVSRIVDLLPAKLLNDVMTEIDILSQFYTFDKQCTDLITMDELPVMVKNYISSLAVENCSNDTLRNYTRELWHFFEYVRKPYNTVTTNDIRCYLYKGQTENGWQPSSKDHVRTVINSFFNWLVDNELLSRNPAKTIKPIKYNRKKLPPLQQIELEKMRNACVNDRERALIDFLYSTGLRISEAAAVVMDDIDWKERSVFVRHGKGDKERTSYFNAEAELSMKRYLSNRKGNDPHLFVKGRAPYNHVSRNTLEHDVKKIRERVPDIKIKVTPHTFRRTMGTTAVARGCPIEQVKQLLGHVSLDTTMQYVTINQEDTKAAHKKYLAG